jgi:ABC-2 type transport system ATP-binding protein
MSEAIRADALVKTFGRTHALDGLDLTVQTGEVHGFLGPNGSGKTTTIRILLGLLRADAGSLSCSAATRGATPRHCTADWRTCPAT